MKTKFLFCFDCLQDLKALYESKLKSKVVLFVLIKSPPIVHAHISPFNNFELFYRVAIAIASKLSCKSIKNNNCGS